MCTHGPQLNTVKANGNPHSDGIINRKRQKLFFGCGEMGNVVGIDVGGTWTRVALANNKGAIIRKEARSVEAGGKDEFLKQLADMTLNICGGDVSSIDGVGIAMAGRLRIMEGKLVYAPHGSLRNIDVVDELRTKLGKEEIFMLNDNVAAAFAEGSIGSGAGQRNMVFVGIGTGIGAGIIVDGRLLIGKEGNAHEVGHMIIDIDGRLTCSCGGRGHWEAYTSGSGLPNLARFMRDKQPAGVSSSPDIMNGAKAIFDAARAGNRFAGLVVDEAARLNAIALANLVDLYDPSLIVIGGGVAVKNGDLVIDRMLPLLSKYCFNATPSVVMASLGEDSSLIGALLWVHDNPLIGLQHSR